MAWLARLASSPHKKINKRTFCKCSYVGADAFVHPHAVGEQQCADRQASFPLITGVDFIARHGIVCSRHQGDALDDKLRPIMNIPSRLYTFGYEGLDIATFIATLRANGVQTIVDVRELPLSRKKGFSKSAFSAILSEAGVAYLHMPALGCPKPIRDRYRADQDWAAYTRDFLAYIDTQDAPVRELVKISKSTAACLVCFEADYTMCHRTYVARAAAQLGAPATWHLLSHTKTAIPDRRLQAVA